MRPFPRLEIEDPGTSPPGRERGPRTREEPPPAHPVVRDLSRRFAALEGSPIFAGSPDSVLYNLARCLHPVALPEGCTVVAEGTSGTSMYMIDEGACEVNMRTADGHDLTLTVLGPGDCFAEHAILSDGPHPVSVRTLRNCRLFSLDREAVATTGRRAPLFVKRLTQIADQRLLGLQRLISRGAASSSRPGAVVLTVYSSTGGAGRTALATNLAAILGVHHPGTALLVDLSLPYNHAALSVGLTPTTSLASMASAPEDALEHLLPGATVHHPGGFCVLSSALRAHEAELVTSQLVARSLNVLNHQFRYVVIDLGGDLSEVALTAFDHSNRLALLTPPEVPALRDTRELLRLLPAALNVPTGQSTLVLNHRSRYSQLGRKDVELILERAVDLEILHDGPKPQRALLEGAVLALSDPSSTITRAATLLASILDEDRQRTLDRRAPPPAPAPTALPARPVARMPTLVLPAPPAVRRPA